MCEVTIVLCILGFVFALPIAIIVFTLTVTFGSLLFAALLAVSITTFTLFVTFTSLIFAGIVSIFARLGGSRYCGVTRNTNWVRMPRRNVNAIGYGQWRVGGFTNTNTTIQRYHSSSEESTTSISSLESATSESSSESESDDDDEYPRPSQTVQIARNRIWNL